MSSAAQVQFVGHRGASYIAPENTLSSAKLAWELNADGVEIDIYYTADNKVIVLHDGSTKRTSGGQADYAPKDVKASVLRTLDMGKWKAPEYAGEKIPFLSEELKLIPKDKSKYLVIEIKTGPEILPAMAKALKKGKRLDQCKFISFNWNSIVETKKMYPNNACYWLSAAKNGLLDKLDEVKAAGLDGVDLEQSLITKEVMDKCSKLGLDVWVWTVDNPESAKRCAALGVSSITTNRPGWLREQLK